MESSEKKNFYVNTVIYFIGTALSKVLMLVVLPIITRFVTTEQYGIYDLIITVSSLLVPLFTFQMIETAYRFIYDAKGTELKQIITNVAASVVTTSASPDCPSIFRFPDELVHIIGVPLYSVAT